MSLFVEPSCVDVNIHPTKHEVFLLNSQLIYNNILQKLTSVLSECSTVKELKFLSKRSSDYSIPIFSPSKHVRVDPSIPKIDLSYPRSASVKDSRLKIFSNLNRSFQGNKHLTSFIRTLSFIGKVSDSNLGIFQSNNNLISLDIHFLV